MQPNQPTQPDAPELSQMPKKQTAVIYISGANRANPENRHSAVIEWYGDNRIRLYASEPTNQLIFDVLVSEIMNFTPQMNRANIELKDGRFIMLDFAGNASEQPKKVGMLTRLFATVDEKEAMTATDSSDLEWWSQNINTIKTQS